LDREVDSAIHNAIAVFRSMGASIQDIELPHSRYGIATYYIIAPCEASSNLARYDGIHYGHRASEKQVLADLAADREQSESEQFGTGESALVRLYRQSRAEGFGAEVKRRIMLGTYALSAGYYDAYYLKALKVRRLIRRDFDEAFQNVDVIVGPTAPRPAFQIGEMADDPLKMYLEDLYTVPANLAGIPGVSIPCGYTERRLPIGLQIQAAPFSEDTLLRAAHMYQSATDWHRQRAEL